MVVMNPQADWPIWASFQRRWGTAPLMCADNLGSVGENSKRRERENGLSAIVGLVWLWSATELVWSSGVCSPEWQIGFHIITPVCQLEKDINLLLVVMLTQHYCWGWCLWFPGKKKLWRAKCGEEEGSPLPQAVFWGRLWPGIHTICLFVVICDQDDKNLKMSRSNIDIDQVVVSRQDMKLLEVLAGRVREERREEEVWK